VPFFVEKPLAVDLPLAEDLARRIAQAGAIVGVGYKFRALDTVPRVRTLLDETPARMVLGAWHDALPPPPWWRQAARGGGQIVEQATHLVDLARLLVGEGEVVSALAGQWPRPDFPDSEVPDVSAALLRFSDVPAAFTVTDLLQGAQEIQLQLVCRGRMLTVTQQHLLIETGRTTEVVAVTADPFVVENLAFLDAVRTHDLSPILSTYADALETHRLCCAIRDRASAP
jgi:predicted dehydrogenase